MYCLIGRTIDAEDETLNEDLYPCIPSVALEMSFPKYVEKISLYPVEFQGFVVMPVTILFFSKRKYKSVVVGHLSEMFAQFCADPENKSLI